MISMSTIAEFFLKIENIYGDFEQKGVRVSGTLKHLKTFFAC